MRFSDFLEEQRIVLPLEATDKWQAIAVLMDRLASSGSIPLDAVKELQDAVLARERSMSTGMERGIAIPHAAVDSLDELVCALGIVQREPGLPFDSLDSQPTRFVVLLLIPRQQKLLHIRTLAEIARLLGEKAVREGLLACETPRAAVECLSEAEARATE
jgi:mannitol/fructose-specific phosphotransferase system IIA component (Ntr-type)